MSNGGEFGQCLSLVIVAAVCDRRSGVSAFSLAPLGEREDRKAEGAPRFGGGGGEGVSADLEPLVELVGCAKVLTPSPVSPRLMKAPVASHPLPQGGEGCQFKTTRRILPRGAKPFITNVETPGPRSATAAVQNGQFRS